MKLQEADMISRFTQATSRNLVLFSAAISAVILFDLNKEKWTIFKDKSIEPDQFILITTVVLIYMIVSHLVHWWADYISYTKWFKRNDVVIGTMGSASAFNNTHPVSVGLAKRIKQLNKSTDNANDRVCELDSFALEDIKNVQGNRNVAQDLQLLRETVQNNKNGLENLHREISDLHDLLHNIGPGFSKITWTSRFVIWGWYLLVPVTLGLASIFLLYCPLKL